MSAQSFNGLDMGMGSLAWLSDAQSRSISPENYNGEKGKGGMAVPSPGNVSRNVNNNSNKAAELGSGWRVNPYVSLGPGETLTIAHIVGPGSIQHIWMTPTGNNWRYIIIRFFWDDEEYPSVECPIADFFCQGWNEYAPVSSLAVCVNPRAAFNCYWPMPFRKECRITLENIDDSNPVNVFYQIDYTLAEVPEYAAYFHAQFRRTRSNDSSVFTILDGIRGKGQYVGTYLAWGVRNNGWWGLGEFKFYIDGDSSFPTICGTGTEDYFCGAHNFDYGREFKTFCTPYSGLCQVIRPDGTYRSQERFGMYRWHIMDPIRFHSDLKITVQDIGLREGGHYLLQHSDISATTFWYQAEPHAKFPEFPGWRDLETY